MVKKGSDFEGFIFFVGVVAPQIDAAINIRDIIFHNSTNQISRITGSWASLHEFPPKSQGGCSLNIDNFFILVETPPQI